MGCPMGCPMVVLWLSYGCPMKISKQWPYRVHHRRQKFARDDKHFEFNVIVLARTRTLSSMSLSSRARNIDFGRSLVPMDFAPVVEFEHTNYYPPPAKLKYSFHAHAQGVFNPAPHISMLCWRFVANLCVPLAAAGTTLASGGWGRIAKQSNHKNCI